MEEKQCLNKIQTDIEVIKTDMSSLREMIETNISSDAERLKKHGEQIDELNKEVSLIKGKSIGSNNLGMIILSVAVVIATLIPIFFGK